MATRRRAKFTTEWKMNWPGSAELASTKLRKDFITAYKNVAYRWHVEVGKLRGGRIPFLITLDDGPKEKMTCVDATITADESAQGASDLRLVTFKRGEAQKIYFTANNAFQKSRTFRFIITIILHSHSYCWETSTNSRIPWNLCQPTNARNGPNCYLRIWKMRESPKIRMFSW